MGTGRQLAAIMQRKLFLASLAYWIKETAVVEYQYGAKTIKKA